MDTPSVNRIHLLALFVFLVQMNPVLASVTFNWVPTGPKDCESFSCTITGPPIASWTFSDAAVARGSTSFQDPDDFLQLTMQIPPLPSWTITDLFPVGGGPTFVRFSDDRLSILEANVYKPAEHTLQIQAYTISTWCESSGCNWIDRAPGRWAVPVPASVYLFVTALVGLIGLRRCKNKVNAFTA